MSLHCWAQRLVPLDAAGARAPCTVLAALPPPLFASAALRAALSCFCFFSLSLTYSSQADKVTLPFNIPAGTLSTFLSRCLDIPKTPSDITTEILSETAHLTKSGLTRSLANLGLLSPLLGNHLLSTCRNFSIVPVGKQITAIPAK